jgi:hypothetical protein
MKVVDPGHVYELAFLDGSPKWHDGSFGCGMSSDTLTFVKREGPGYPGNADSYPGTTLQEVLRACIDRVRYLDRQVPDAANQAVILELQAAISHLEERAARRHGRRFDYSQVWNIEQQPTCPSCLHIGCDGTSCRTHRASLQNP